MTDTMHTTSMHTTSMHTTSMHTTMIQTIQTPQDSTRAALAIGNAHGQLCAIAARAYEVGDEIVHLTGALISMPTRFSVQVGEDEHVEPPSDAELEELIGEHSWRYMNHSCEPNTAFRGRTLIALHRIAPGDEVRFHYAATEYQMAEPFVCRCGATACVGSLQGYRSLVAEQRQRIASFAQPHVLAAAACEDRNSRA